MARVRCEASLLTHKGGSIIRKISSTVVAVVFVAFAYLAPADDVKKAVDETGDAAKKAVKWLASRLTAAS